MKFCTPGPDVINPRRRNEAKPLPAKLPMPAIVITALPLLVSYKKLAIQQPSLLVLSTTIEVFSINKLASK